MKPYPKTKPSGVESLGEVPEHWEVKRLRRILGESLKYGANESAELDDPELPRYVRITDVHDDGTLRPETFRSLPKDVAAPYLLEDGDLLFARSGATSGKTFLYQNSWGICAYAGYLIRARMDQKKAVPAFVKYFTASRAYWQWLSSIFIQSTIQNVSAEKYADLQLSLPPVTEQAAIAAYLDRETGRMDELVGKKRELIERLKEKRTALISRTVTRGLPADLPLETLAMLEEIAGEKLSLNPPLKSSGIDWFGEVPEHWEIAELRRFTRFITSGSRGWAEHYSDEGSIFVRIGNLTRHSIEVDLSDIQHVDPPAGAEGERTRIEPGDVLFSITAYLGSVAVATESIRGAFINQHIALVRLEHKLEPRFAAYSTLGDAGQMQLGGLGYGGTKIQLSLDDVKSLWLCVPPRPEQRAIAAYLDQEAAKLDALVAKVETAIERLQEYRTALITAAVTGKIDVREEMAA